MSQPITLSVTAQAVLAAAAQREDRLALPLDRLPAAARRAVAHSMLKAGLVEEVPAEDGQSAWRTAVDGERWLLRATPAGLAAVGLTEPEPGLRAPLPPSDGPGAGDGGEPTPGGAITQLAAEPPRFQLREAAEKVLVAWDGEVGRPGLEGAVAALRGALAGTVRHRPVGAAGARRAPRAGTKQQAVLDLLCRAQGASVAQVAEVTGWAPHTVRGFFAGLKKKGVEVTVLEQVRQVGPGKQGAKGSYSLYRVVKAG